MSRPRRLYWLFDGERPLTAVMLPEGVNHRAVIRQAIRNHRERPITREPGYEKRLLKATVKTLGEGQTHETL